MAVSKYKNVWVLTAEDDVTAERVFKKVRWVCVGGAGGSQCILTDLEGNAVFHSVAWGSNFVDPFEFPLMDPIAIKVDTLSAGMVYLYE